VSTIFNRGSRYWFYLWKRPCPWYRQIRKPCIVHRTDSVYRPRIPAGCWYRPRKKWRFYLCSALYNTYHCFFVRKGEGRRIRTDSKFNVL